MQKLTLVFAKEEEHEHDLLNDIEHGLKIPVEVCFIFLWINERRCCIFCYWWPTWLVLAGLFIGKPFGIFICGWIAAKPLNFWNARRYDICWYFCIRNGSWYWFYSFSIVASIAFDPGAVQDAAKMGALLSFAAAIISIILGILFKIKKYTNYIFGLWSQLTGVHVLLTRGFTIR